MPRQRKHHLGSPKALTIPTHVRTLCRDYTEEGVLTIVEIMRDKTNAPAVRLHAACTLLDRGWPRRQHGPLGYEDQYGDRVDGGGERLTVVIRNIVEGKNEEVVQGRPAAINGHSAPIIEHEEDQNGNGR